MPLADVPFVSRFFHINIKTVRRINFKTYPPAIYKNPPSNAEVADN